VEKGLRRISRLRAACAGAVALAVGAMVAPNASGHGVGPSARVPEKKLLKLETRALGHAHALEHRRARREARRLAALLGPPEKPRTRRSMAVGAPADVGQWSGTTHIDVTGVHAMLLPTGKVLFFNYGPSENGIASIWDPLTGTSHRVDPPGGDNVWCGGQTLLADGRVMIAGGNIPQTGEEYRGLDTIYTFDPWNETWMLQGRMAGGRWYPTTTLMPDGRVVITSGLVGDGSGDINDDVEVFTPSQDPLERGTIEVVNRRLLSLYPFQHVVRDGRVLVTGPERADAGFLSLPDWGFTPMQYRPLGTHGRGSAVLLPDGPDGSSKVMVIGGAGQDGVEVIDAENLAAGWTARAPLPQPRRNANSVLTPDGALITIGGNLEDNFTLPQKEALRYDPGADAWTPLAAQKEERGYHSTALLLPDGRIVSAGDDGPTGGGGQDDQIEVFSPPYLFKGPRPRIDSAPAAVGYGRSFAVASPDADIARAVLVAPGATTHANDMHQRLVPLRMTPTAGGLLLTAPASTSIAPPGYYMLFVVDSAGVPSIARFIRLSAETAEPEPGTGAPGGAPPGAVPGGAVPGGAVPEAPVPGGRATVAPLPARSYWREGFENPIPGVSNASRVGAAFSGRRALWVGSGALVPGPALKGGRYRASLRVRNGGVRLSATVQGRTVTLALAARPGKARWRHVTDEVRIASSGRVQVRLKVGGGWAIADDVVLARRRR
jgi:hypothetical protein